MSSDEAHVDACHVQEAAVKANAKLEEIVLHCPRGPQVYRNQMGQASESAVVSTLPHAGNQTLQELQRSCTTTGFTVKPARQAPYCLALRIP